MEEIFCKSNYAIVVLYLHVLLQQETKQTRFTKLSGINFRNSCSYIYKQLRKTVGMNQQFWFVSGRELVSINYKSMQN